MSFSGASISLATQQNISHNTETIIVFETDDFDVGGWIDNTTEKRLKIPADVAYAIFGIAGSMTGLTTADMVSMRLYEETLGILRLWDWQSIGSAIFDESFTWATTPIAVTKDQVYYLQVYQGGGATETVPSDDGVAQDPFTFTVERGG